MIFYDTIRYFKSCEHHAISMGDLKDDIRRGESQTLELKRGLSDNPLKYVRTAVAFANGRGGRIVFGVEDSREIVGLEGDPWRVADVAVDTIMNRCEPQVPVESYVVTVDGKDLAVLEVSPGQNRPYHLKSSGVGNSTYVRISATTRLADEERLRDLMLEGRRVSYDALDHTGIILDSGSPEIISMCSYLSGRGSGRFDATRLANMGLIREGHEGYIPTRAFMMLSTNPFPHAMVQCARFRGQDRTVFLDRKEYGGNLMEQVEAATGFILNYLPCRAEIGAVYRKDIFEIPQEAVREAVTNAVLHRSYSIESGNVRVALYDDRLEVTSPGGIPFGMTVDEAMSGRSRPRNPVVSRFFREAGLVEGWGSGLGRIVTACREAGLPDPVMSDDGDEVRLTIFRSEGEGEMSIDQGDMGELDEMLDMMVSCPDIRIDSLSESLGVSKATVNRMISRAKSAGLLRRVGSRKTGRWAVDRTSTHGCDSTSHP